MVGKTTKNDLDDLYICMYDITNKRKNILSALKTSLIAQEEYEKIIELRKQKQLLLKKVKENIDQINVKYQEIKKELPNVKNVLSFTEKEITVLDNQIEMLKHSITSEEEIIEEAIKKEEELKKLKTNVKEIQKQTEKNIKKTTHKAEPSKKLIKSPRSLSKIDRIRNNLSLIEEKLKKL
jgi:septal ring factor EnvC (AmiA/AmiB activator)